MQTTIWQAMMTIPGRASLKHREYLTALIHRLQVLVRIDAIQQLYVAHTQAAIDAE